MAELGWTACRAEVEGDLAFSVTDDQAEPFAADGAPVLGYYDSLLTPDRWSYAAAAAVSSRSIVEVWRDGRGYRQELAGLRPLAVPVEIPSRGGAGTRFSCVLDADYFGAGVIGRDLADLDVHGPHCTGGAGPGSVTVRDLRRPE